jgi:hypothetical protein
MAWALEECVWEYQGAAHEDFSALRATTTDELPLCMRMQSSRQGFTANVTHQTREGQCVFVATRAITTGERLRYKR